MNELNVVNKRFPQHLLIRSRQIGIEDVKEGGRREYSRFSLEEGEEEICYQKI
jgi:hypothetical protein